MQGLATNVYKLQTLLETCANKPKMTSNFSFPVDDKRISLQVLEHVEEELKTQKIKMTNCRIANITDTKSLEVLARIFSSQNCKTEKLRLLSINERFLSMCSPNENIIHFSFKDMAVDALLFVNFLKKIKRIKSLVLSSVTFLNMQKYEFSVCTTIEDLECTVKVLSFIRKISNIHAFKVRTFLEAIELVSQNFLKELSITQSYESPETASLFFKQMTKNSTLQTLNICGAYNEMCVTSFEGAFLENSSLTSLKVGGVTPDCVLSLLNGTNKISDLVVTFHEEGDYFSICDFIQKTTTVQSLSMTIVSYNEDPNYCPPPILILDALYQNSSISSFIVNSKIGEIDFSYTSKIIQIFNERPTKLQVFHFNQKLHPDVLDFLPVTLRELGVNISDDISLHQSNLEKFISTSNLQWFSISNLKGLKKNSFFRTLCKNTSMTYIFVGYMLHSQFIDKINFLMDKNKGKLELPNNLQKNCRNFMTGQTPIRTLMKFQKKFGWKFHVVLHPFHLNCWL